MTGETSVDWDELTTNQFEQILEEVGTYVSAHPESDLSQHVAKLMGSREGSLGHSVLEMPIVNDSKWASDAGVRKIISALSASEAIRKVKFEDGSGDKRIKLSIEVTPALNRVIEHIAESTGVTKSEAIRKAIVLMEVAVEAKENGERLFVGSEPPPGASREIIGL